MDTWKNRKLQKVAAKSIQTATSTNHRETLYISNSKNLARKVSISCAFESHVFEEFISKILCSFSKSNEKLQREKFLCISESTVSSKIQPYRSNLTSHSMIRSNHSLLKRERERERERERKKQQCQDIVDKIAEV